MRAIARRSIWILGGIFLIAAAEAAPLHDEIDKAINAKAGGPVAERASDAEFLRRVYLDFIGKIPTVAEARAFLADKDTKKREKLIDRLLASAKFPRRMEEALNAMLLERRASAGKVPDAKWRDWLRGAFAKNMPWDELVRELLLAEGDIKANPAAKFLTDVEKLDYDRMTQDVARLFLGINLQCAQCHDHPMVDEYLQSDYFGLYAYLSTSKLADAKTTKATFLVEGVATNKVEFKSVFKKDRQNATGPRLPGRSEVEIPAFAKGEEFAEPPKDGLPGVPKFRPRALLARELTAPDNRHFTRNSANRFWFLLMGRGLVHPLDFMHKDNPPSHPELLDLLAREFAAHQFDVKWLLREIALSEAYQRSSRAPAGVDAKSINPASYRVANDKPLSPEQMAWATMQATGELDRLVKEPASRTGKFNLKSYLSGASKEPPVTLDDTMNLFVATFANPPGEPEVDFAPSMAHSLFLMNERLLLGWLKPAEDNLVGRLAKLSKPDEIAGLLYINVLTRPPEKEESEEVARYLEKNRNRYEAALGELAWALIASAEFRLNH